MSNTYVMGVDIGTTGTKAMIFDLAANVAGVGYREYLAKTPQPDWFEFDAEDLIAKTFEACREAIEKSGLSADAIAAVSFSTQRATVGFIDEKDEVIENIMYSWQDNRAFDEAEYMKSVLPEREIVRITGMPVTQTYAISKVLWVRKHKPEQFKKAKKIVLLSDLLMKRFGAKEYYSDWGNASCFGLMDMRAREWSGKLLSAFGLQGELFAKPIPSGTDLGYVSEAAASLSGLTVSTKLIAGSGDQSCGALGAGVIKKGIAEMTIGTAGHLISYIDEPIDSEETTRMMTVNAAIPGNYELNGIQLSAASIYRWFRDHFAALQKEQGGRQGVDPYVLINAMAEKSKPGSNGLVLLPYLAAVGSPHWDVDATGVLLGLTLRHTTGDVARAFMEGCIYEMREIVETMKNCGVEFKELRITGGASKSPLWRQIMADILNLPLRRLVVSDATVLGAAIIAAYGMGAFASIEEGAGHMVKLEETILPIKENAKKYEELYRLFQKTYQTLAGSGVFGKLRQIRDEIPADD